MITDIGHMAIRCHDLERSLGFYSLLGIQESFRLHRDDGSLALVYLHVGGDRFLELFPNGPLPSDPAGSFFHLCLLTDDIGALENLLRDNEIPIWRPTKRGSDGNLQLWVKDPDGNPIEFMQLVEDSPQRRAARNAV